MSSELGVTFEYNKKDIINFVLDTYSFEKVKCFLFLLFNISTFIIGLIFLFKKQMAAGTLFIGLSISVFPLALVVAYMQSSHTLTLVKSVVCALKNDGLDFISNLGEVLIPYKDIFDVKVTEELILVYTSPTRVHVIPKRAFKSTTSAIDFAACLIERFKTATGASVLNIPE